MKPSPPVLLPSRYYLDHFNEMLDFVLAGYGHALSTSHRFFVNDFRALSLDARCLYVRLANRKGRVFFRPYLRYEEIESIESALDELRNAGFVRPPGPEDFAELLALQSRTDLVALIKSKIPSAADNTPKLSSAKKTDLVRYCAGTLPFSECFPGGTSLEYLVQDRVDEIDYFLFLYFGTLRDGLTSFALRDLGLLKTSDPGRRFEARFETAEIAWNSFYFSRILTSLENPTRSELPELLSEAPDWPVTDDLEVETLRHRALYRLGLALERSAGPEEALRVFRLSDQFPATERTVRLLLREGRRSEAETLLLHLIENPSCDEELIFAEDFYERKFHRKKLGRLTAVLREAPVLSLDESDRDRPEAGAVRYFARQGLEAAHVENLLWTQLFGLLFWDLIFDPATAAIHNPFEVSARELRAGAFYSRHQGTIEERLTLLDDKPAVIRFLDQSRESLPSATNLPGFWDSEILPHVRRLVELAPPRGLATILMAMAENYRSNRSGFPDLVVYEGDSLRFVEIKTEGDQIRRNQLAQIERLKRAGFAVELAKVRWIVDPEQEYVVVDIETTGGNPGANRITEIGAVRVRGNRIVGEWASLVNPGRGIPKFIVGLTGITDAMVAEAPRFEEIATPFRDFVGDAVFVAHRVKFDYGFLRSEFERIGENFRCPTLCTVVAMRRYFRGLPSYGLGALCKAFDIPLESHHRALCDARATAELLKKINAKRMEETMTEPLDP